MIPGFVVLHLRRLLDHPGRVAMALIGIAAGTSLIVAITGIYTSITGSVSTLTDLAGDADLEIAPVTDSGLRPTVMETVSSTGGVEAVAPLIRSWVAVDGEVVLLVAGDHRTAALTGAVARGEGSDAAADVRGLVVTDALADALDLHGGGAVAVHSNAGGTAATDVLAVLGGTPLDDANGGRIALTGLAHAQELLGRGDRLDAVLVGTAPGADISAVRDQLQQALGSGVLVEDRDTRNDRIAAPAVTYLSQIGPVSAMALVVGGFLVFNTMNMAALERRRELATLRTLGASRRRLVAGFLGEATVLGVAGSLLGAVAGVVLARVVVSQLPVAMEQAVGTEIRYALPAVAVVPAVVLGVAASTVAAAIPALHATRAHPLDALRPAGPLAAGGAPTRVSRRPLLAGGSLAAAGVVVLLTLRGDRAAGGILLLTLGAVLASYGLAPLTAAAAARLSRLCGGLGHLAATGTARAPHRVWATTMAVTLAVTMTVAVASGARNQLDLDRAHLAELRDTDLIVAAHPLDQLAVDVRLPEELPDRIASVGGVDELWTLTTQHAVLDGKSFLLYGADAAPGRSSFPPLDLAPPAARRAALAGDAVILSHQFAREFGLDVGDTAIVPGPVATLRLPVAAVVETLSVSDNGMVVVADSVLRRVFGTRGISSIDVRLGTGADAAAVRGALEAMAADATHPMVVTTGEEGYRAILAGITAVVGLMYAVLAVTAGVAAIAVLNTLLASVVDRWRELGVLRAVGTTPRQLAVIVGLEAAGFGVLGSLAGLALGSAVHWAGIRYVGDASPLPVEYAFVPEVLAVAALAGVGATLVGALIPVRRAVRLRVLDAIAWE